MTHKTTNYYTRAATEQNGYSIIYSNQEAEYLDILARFNNPIRIYEELDLGRSPWICVHLAIIKDPETSRSSLGLIIGEDRLVRWRPCGLVSIEELSTVGKNILASFDIPLPGLGNLYQTARSEPEGLKVWPKPPLLPSPLTN